METSEATQVMQEANRIIQDFSVNRYALYKRSFFLLEIGLCFWIGLKL